MDRYAYLLLGLSLLAPLVAILCIRKDMASKAIKLGMLGGVVGLLSEFFYFRDYWRPISLFGTAAISVEDFIFGFSITALSFVAYSAILNAKFTPSKYPQRRKLYALFFLFGLMAMVLFNLYLGVNSIFVSSITFLILTTVMLFIRRDLIKMSLYSAVIIMAFIILIYVILFDVVSPHFWDSYWLLANTKWGVTVLGNVPLTELIWYLSWVLFASISYPFVSGASVSTLQE